MPRISIIVPVYNVEKYLNRCVDSILSQTFTDFECILVDDGSPDNCGKICDEYAKKDKRVKVIHKQNGGLSSARNAGIDIAQGEYLGFIDSDDWIHPQFLEILYEGIVKNNVLLSVCAYEEVEKEKKIKKIENANFEICSGVDFLIKKNVTAVIAPNKLYHRSLFDGIRYPIGRLHEDEFVTYKLLYKAGNIAFCNEKLYMYFMNMNGITKGEYTPRHLDALEAWEERDKWLIEHKLFEYRKWTRRQLLEGYAKHHYLIGNNIDLKRYKRIISRKMAFVLIFEGKKLDIDSAHYLKYLNVAFPHMMRICYLFKMLKKKYSEHGLTFCIKKSLKYFFKR